MNPNETNELHETDDPQADNAAERPETTEAPAGEQPAPEPVAADETGAEPDAGGSREADPEIERLRKLADDHQNRYLRAQADFDNFRRRTVKEREELAQYASMKLVGQLLPVLDNFERALQTGGEAAEGGSFAKGVDMIYRQLVQVLEAEGLKAMDAVGQPFDPALHQAIMQVASDEHEEGTVVEAVQTGYLLKDKVIRPAMVKVSG